MNLTDLQTAAQLLGVPVSFLIIGMALWLTVGKWLRDVIIPEWLEAQKLQAKAMDDIAEIVRSLQYEVRESRRVSDKNAETLARMDTRLDQAIGRPGNGRARSRGE
jgi:hypothetical protein